MCPTASWNPHAITFANQTIVGTNPLSLFVNTNNTVYVANRDKNEIIVWLNNSVNPTTTISGSFSNPQSIFVTTIGDIYIDDGQSNGRVQRWISNTNTFATVMNVELACFGLFVDINDTLYCSMWNRHKVMKRWLDESGMTSTLAAGTSTAGSAPDQLDRPYGIFVDVNFDLYVADCGNHRIQLFPFGQQNGITVAGAESADITITLTCPNGVVLDADRYLFIVDYGNHRIIGSGPGGYRCVVGCDGQGGSQSNQLSHPFTLSFDRDGNIFVSDPTNDRIQKFVLSTNSCGKCERVKEEEEMK